MKISYIVLKGMPFCGGIERYTEEVGSRLAARGHKVTVYSMAGESSSTLLYRGMVIKNVPFIKSRSLSKITASFMATMQECLSGDADIVHFHAFGPAMFCFLPRLLGRRVVVQGHGLEWKRSRWSIAGRFFLKLTELPSVLFPHALTVVSREQRSYLQDKYGRSSIYIPTGVSVPDIAAPKMIIDLGLRGNDYILFAARLVREKGAHVLIDAFRRMKSDLKLVLAGDAEHEERYKAELRARAKGDDNILFLGFATGRLLQELYSNCAIFVLPSSIEGLPTALLEAMSYGNCCLVSDIPENVEAISQLGYTFRSGDVDDLARKLEYLCTNQNAVNAFKQQAREYALKNYLWDGIADKFETFYTSVKKQ